MAKIISPRILTPSTSLLPLPLKSLFPSQSLAISTKPIITPRFRRKPNRPSLMARASSTAAAVVPDDISDVLGEVSIFTAAGEPVQLKDLWDQQEGIAVVALLRHFGCFCCWELAASLKEAKEKLDSAGVKLIALPFPMDSLYADPDRKAYDVLGLYYGFRRTFLNPASIKVFSRYEELKKAMKNYTIRATPDDTSSVLQQGGMFVFKGKQLLYARKDEGTGDHAPLDEILDICCKVPTP
ncbi:thioredoxin-like protein AAED1, chloroplastic isoform X2 [Salvia miltiorrhiza]|uniref:thioredoxin-like protein AAED1, chloroplastic isoform X2 n=1 Tax=Salvia miltiorrhiza TaxID=226208 RepID=UPI0025ABAE35|nr:thioredoxin-like protein AAED1, chloroplastic isoform X2 [Salvia miltiorrhiza]